MGRFSRAEAAALLAPITRERTRVLSPMVTLGLVFFVAAAGPLGIRPSGQVSLVEYALCVASALLSVALVLQRVPARFLKLAACAILWFPMAATLLPLCAMHDAMYALFVIVQIVWAGMLLHTMWMVGTVIMALAFAIPGITASGSPYTTLFIAVLVSAALFSLFVHGVLRRALLREARTSAELARKLEEHERLQGQLLHAQRMEAVGTLAAGVAHDMNNVLGSIRSFATLLAEEQHPPSSELAQIVAQAERGGALTRGLLAFSRRGQYRKQVVHVGQVVRDVLPLLARTLPKSLTVRDELSFGDACIEADPAHLTQVLVNLALNAADAMDAAGTLVIAGELVAGRARLRVIDTGKGMDEATRLRVFEPFFTTKPIGVGTGLGLSTAWGIVDAHGGTIEVESTVGRGTTFTVWLPLTGAKPAAPLPPPTIREIATARRVLVVDDEHTIRASSRRLLERLGISVEVAADGAEALRVFDACDGAFDVIVLDMGMPVMNGAECFRRLREKSNVPVLISTGYAVDSEVQALVAAGATVIEKPYPADEFRREVARLMGHGGDACVRAAE